jgi:hypothetical protein
MKPFSKVNQAQTNIFVAESKEISSPPPATPDGIIYIL